MKKWLPENSGDVIIKSFLFLISPFISFLAALYRIKSRSSFVIFYLFAFFYGMSFMTESGKSETAGNDGAVFRALFEMEICGMQFDEYVREIGYILSGQSWHKDIYFHSVAYWVSQYTHNYHYLFLAFAVVFGYFMLRSLAFLVKDRNFNGGIICFLLVLLFVTNGIFNINGMRFWTATWIATYALMRILIENRKLYIILLCITPLVHSSFYFLLLLFAIYWLSGDNKSGWIKFYYISFFFSGLSAFIISAFIGDIPYLSRFMVYLGEDTSFLEGKSVMKAIFDVLSIIYINGMFYLIYKKAKHSIPEQGCNVYNFFIVFITIVNFVRPIPSLGSRYFIMSFPFIAYLWLVTFGTKQYKWVIYTMPVAMLWYLHNSYILFVYFLEPDFYYTNPFTLISRYL